MKLCKDCKHHQNLGAMFYNASRCLHGTPIFTDYVHGGTYPSPYANVINCNEQRSYEDKCGPGAKWFEPKTEVFRADRRSGEDRRKPNNGPRAFRFWPGTERRQRYRRSKCY